MHTMLERDELADQTMPKLRIPVSDEVIWQVMHQNGNSSLEHQNVDDIQTMLDAELAEFWQALAAAEAHVNDPDGNMDGLEEVVASEHIVPGEKRVREVIVDSAIFHLGSEVGDVVYLAIRLHMALKRIDVQNRDETLKRCMHPIHEVIEIALELGFDLNDCVLHKRDRNALKYKNLYANKDPAQQRQLEANGRAEWREKGGDDVFDLNAAAKSRGFLFDANTDAANENMDRMQRTAQYPAYLGAFEYAMIQNLSRN